MKAGMCCGANWGRDNGRLDTSCSRTDTADFALSEKRQMDDWDEPLLTQTPCMRRCGMLWP